MPEKILVLDNEISVCDKLENLLRNNGYITAGTHHRKEALQLIKATPFALVICDCRLKDTYAVEFIHEIKNIHRETKLIFTGVAADMETSIELMHQGAFYFLVKPLNAERVLEKVSLALSERKPAAASAVKEKSILRQVPYQYIRGKSDAANKLCNELELVAPTDYTVIIHGETGTGKESVARLIHENSSRSKGPFIPIDCGSLSKELAASELFGHEKGAFTGALTDKTGAFELANEGTLFLDEIGNLAYEVQLFLLRALEERVVRKVGGVRNVAVNVRLLVATNEHLLQAVSQKKFREDLYHRLNEFSIQVPSLRERREDLPVFVHTFISEAAKRLEKNIPGISEKAWELLNSYAWPGNIRELKNAIKNACLRTPDKQNITEKALPHEIRYSGAMRARPAEEGRTPAQAPETPENLREVAINAERDTILRTLEKVNFNKRKAAEILKIDRKTLYNKLGRLSADKTTGPL